ncbi:HAD family phosphatase [Nocardioides sp. zg-1228]|uniref:HAD family hydrolase n=1 Tax=Nocardioides sp. zg-1228 TaxID=2763008 RepID=UPI0016430F59|nr:HAD family phosphatase [Nocardioides sp. zg-1228]
MATGRLTDPPGVVFDLDGTLIDSEPSWARGFSLGLAQVLEAHGHGTHDLRPEDMARFQGGRVPDTVAATLADLGLDAALDAGETRQVVQAVIDWVCADVAAAPVPIPEAVELAHALHRRGIRLAVASSSALPFIDAALEVLGLREAIPVRTSAIDLPRGKPDPLVYVLTLHEMGLPASRVVAIEDSPVGVESAVRAGLRCVWFMPGAPDAERADRVRALKAADTGSGTLAAQVDALVAPVPHLRADDVLRMIGADAR